VAAGAPVPLLLVLLPVGALAAAALGAILEPTLLRPFYRRAEEYQLLVTFGLLMILEDLMRFIWGPYPLSASEVFENFGSLTIGDSIYPTYNLLVIGVGVAAAIFLWAFIYRTKFGIVLRATSQNMRMASALGVNVNRVYVEAFTLGCFMAGLGGAIIVPSQSAVLGMGVDALILAFIVVVIGGLGSSRARSSAPSSSGSSGRPGSRGSRRSSWRSSISRRRSCCSRGPPVSSDGHEHPGPRPPAAPRRLVREGASRRGADRVLLALVPLVAPPYGRSSSPTASSWRSARSLQPAPRLHGLLSFGHSAYFGVGAYAVALMVKYLKVGSMELFLVGAIVASVLVTALFGVVCVRYTRIFFGILTLALSQVLWSLAFKFFW